MILAGTYSSPSALLYGSEVGLCMLAVGAATYTVPVRETVKDIFFVSPQHSGGHL